MNTEPTNKENTEQIIQDIRSKESDYWHNYRKKKNLDLFHEVAKRVPAYKDFLRKNNINPTEIKTWDDMKIIPQINKKNYLRAYKLNELCWDGNLKKPLVFTSTSGSTGEPVYFPRNQDLDWQYSIIIEEYLKQSSNFNNGSTLVIIGFGMGVWIGGLMTYKAFEIAAQRMKCSVSIITPGVNKDQILKSLKNLSPYFSQTILVGYPPFSKDVIEEAIANNIDIGSLNIRLFFAAESFTENFRDYLISITNIKSPELDTLNIYGSADLGAMAWESPLSILVRRVASKNKKTFISIFGDIDKTPTLAQFNPYFINFESDNGELLLTGDSAVPLIKYAIGDQGGVLSYDEINKRINPIILEENIKEKRLNKFLYKLPFVFVYERSDFSVSFYGIQIYPEYIKDRLMIKNFITLLTGKFSMMIRYDTNQDQYLEINLELHKDINIDEEQKKKLEQLIFEDLQNRSSEFSELSKYLGKRAIPKLVFWPYEDPMYFKPGIKQKWLIK